MSSLTAPVGGGALSAQVPGGDLREVKMSGITVGVTKLKVWQEDTFLQSSGLEVC